MSRESNNNRNFLVNPELLPTQLTFTDAEGNETIVVIPVNSEGEQEVDQGGGESILLSWKRQDYL